MQGLVPPTSPTEFWNYHSFGVRELRLFRNFRMTEGMCLGGVLATSSLPMTRCITALVEPLVEQPLHSIRCCWCWSIGTIPSSAGGSLILMNGWLIVAGG